MQKTFRFGPVAIEGKRPVNDVEITVRYEKNDRDLDTLSISGTVWNSRHKDCLMGGQCLDGLVPYLKKDKLFMTILGLWRRDHLNDLDSCANDDQRKAVKEFMKDNSYDYTRVCDFLKRKNLYEVIVDGKKCRYGAEWYYREIPEKDKRKILEILKD